MGTRLVAIRVTMAVLDVTMKVVLVWVFNPLTYVRGSDGGLWVVKKPHGFLWGLVVYFRFLRSLCSVEMTQW